LAKTGKTVGLTAVKTSLKTGIKEGVEQGARNLVIENSYGGNNEWWNIHPARFPNEHQAGIHRTGSPARELFK
jgi:UPF0720 protein yxiD